MAFVYLLHFDTPLCHAEHYVGSTTNLLKRLQQHATLKTTPILKATKKWSVERIWQGSPKAIREAERQIKRQKNGPAFCPLCSPTPRVPPPKLLDYPITEPIKEALKARTPKRPEMIEIRHGTWYNVEEIEALMSQSTLELGFIPREGIKRHLNKERCLVAYVGTRVQAYCLFTYSHDSTRLTINQVTVSDEQRLRGIGKALVLAAQCMNPVALPVCRVRDDLPANEFWAKIGWERVRSTKGKRHPLNHYHGTPICY